MPLVGPATQILGVASIAGGVFICTTGPWCVVGTMLAGSGVLEIGAGFGLEYAAYLRAKAFLEEGFEVTP